MHNLRYNYYGKRDRVSSLSLRWSVPCGACIPYNVRTDSKVFNHVFVFIRILCSSCFFLLSFFASFFLLHFLVYLRYSLVGFFDTDSTRGSFTIRATALKMLLDGRKT